jgi:hypothetical protein
VVSESGVGWRKFVRLTTKKPTFAAIWGNHASAKRSYVFGMLGKRTKEVTSIAQGEPAISGWGLFKTILGMEWTSSKVLLSASRNDKGSSSWRDKPGTEGIHSIPV